MHKCISHFFFLTEFREKRKKQRLLFPPETSRYIRQAKLCHCTAMSTFHGRVSLLSRGKRDVSADEKRRRRDRLGGTGDNWEIDRRIDRWRRVTTSEKETNGKVRTFVCVCVVLAVAVGRAAVERRCINNIRYP